MESDLAIQAGQFFGVLGDVVFDDGKLKIKMPVAFISDIKIYKSWLNNMIIHRKASICFWGVLLAFSCYNFIKFSL